jgi:hypothetical protein
MTLSILLGIVLAFITVLLLLSLVVMALVQFSQAVLRLRARNLLVGVSWLLPRDAASSSGTASSSPSSSSPASAPAPAGSRLRGDERLRKAALILNEATEVRRRLVPDRDPNSAINVVRGPKVAWVDPDDLALAFKEVEGKQVQGRQVEANDAAPAEPGAVDTPATSPEGNLKERFEKLEPAMSDRFATIIQHWTIAWSIVVAILFQVSTPTLLHSLAVSDARREAIVAMVPDVVKQAETIIPAAMADDFVDRALARLAVDYPNHTDLFAQVSGSTDSREGMLEELRAVLAGVAERDVMVARYARIIDELSTRDADSAIKAATGAIDSLDIAGIGFWREGTAFYYSDTGFNVQNIFGVLMTAILLSFGAPFWFEQLKNVANLRNVLSKERPAEAR